GTNDMRVCLPGVRRRDYAPPSSLTNASYASASINDSTPAGSLTPTLTNQPSSYGEELTSSGESTTVLLASITSPLIGAWMSEAALTDSITPIGSPCVTVVPGSGSSR